MTTINELKKNERMLKIRDRVFVIITLKNGHLFAKCPSCKKTTELEMSEEYTQGNYYNLRISKDYGRAEGTSWEDHGEGYLQRDRYDDWDSDSTIKIICSKCQKERKDITIDMLEELAEKETER